MWEFVELEIDELVNLAGRDVGLDGTFDIGKEVGVGGEGLDLGDAV